MQTNNIFHVKSTGGNYSNRDKKSLYRALVNVRQANPISEDFLKIEDEYLQEDDPDVFLLDEERVNREHIRDILAEDNYDYGEAKY